MGSGLSLGILLDTVGFCHNMPSKILGISSVLIVHFVVEMQNENMKYKPYCISTCVTFIHSADC